MWRRGLSLSTRRKAKSCRPFAMFRALSVSPPHCVRRAPKSKHPPDVRDFGAGEGNRTLVVSLEGFCSTIELHPRRAAFATGVRRASTPRDQIVAPSRAATRLHRPSSATPSIAGLAKARRICPRQTGRAAIKVSFGRIQSLRHRVGSARATKSYQVRNVIANERGLTLSGRMGIWQVSAWRAGVAQW